MKNIKVNQVVHLMNYLVNIMTNKELKRCQYLWEKQHKGDSLNKSEQTFYEERKIEFLNSQYHFQEMASYQMNKNIIYGI